MLAEPRLVLAAVTTGFREMNPNREEAYCCGGGSGLVALPEAAEIRLLAGRPKADQIKRSGAQIVAAACENCRLQLGDVSSHYGLGVGVVALADLVVKAMRLPGSKDSIEEMIASEASKL